MYQLRRRMPAADFTGKKARGAWVVFGAALALRTVFAVLTGGTYDYDEFVLLLLARDFAHGSVPYADFMFFHPPGVLVLLRLIEPMTSLWWPSARVATLGIDSCTSVLVYLIAHRLWNWRTGVIAGILYAANPLALVSAVRIGQDPLVTFTGTAGLAIVVLYHGRKSAALAGALAAGAVWLKYPAILFVPVYVLASPRRAGYMLAGFATACVVLLVPFHSEWHVMYRQTVTFQRTRWKMVTSVRIQTTLMYWIGVNCLALLGVLRRSPGWLRGGFLLGGVFVFSSQVYYHYFVPVVVFGCLLAAPALAGVTWLRPRIASGAAVLIMLLWSSILTRGGSSPLYVTAAHLADVAPVVSIVQNDTRPGQPVLADRFEYAYLARRPALDHYFWNVGVLVTAKQLEAHVGRARAVVLSQGASSGYPAGFVNYLNMLYTRTNTRTARVWLVRAGRLAP